MASRGFVGGLVDTVDMYDSIKSEEVFAARFVTAWVSKRGRVQTLGNGDTPDIQINYLDNSIAYCEVKRDADRDEEQLRSRLIGHGDLVLRPGSGSWLVTLSKIVDFYTFNAKLQEVVDDLTTIGINDWDYRNTVIKFRSQDFLIEHGVESFRLVTGYSDDRLMIFRAPDAGAVIEDANILIPWLESVQYRSKYISPIKRLALNNSIEQHLFIFVDSNTPLEIALVTEFHPTVLPSEKLHLSPKLTHLWVAPFYNFHHNHDCAWLYADEKGWQLIQISREQVKN